MIKLKKGLQMRSVLIVAALATGLAGSVAAQTYVAENRLKVVPLNSVDFEVIEARGEGARGIWCAAASYVSFVKGMERNTRMYIKSPRGPSVSGAGRKGVVFTTDANRLSQGPSKSLSVSTRTIGVGLPVAHAIQFCRDNIIEPDDIFYRRKGT
jgi:hypothetical protein